MYPDIVIYITYLLVISYFESRKIVYRNHYDPQNHYIFETVVIELYIFL